MSLFVYLDGVNVPTSRIRLRGSGDTGIEVASSADGEQSEAGVVFDDPTGDWTVTGWMPFVVDEPACTARRLFTGYIGDRTYRRGHYRLSSGREIDTTVLDSNVLLRMHRLNGADTNRPAETDIQRLNWLMASGYIPVVQDLGLITGTGLPMEAHNYKRSLPTEVLDDLAAPYGQTYFVYYDQDAQALGLFFDMPTAVTFTSSLTISNVLSDVDNVTCFAPDIDATSMVDPSEVYGNIAVVYTGGAIYLHNQTTNDQFFSSDLTHRDTLLENAKIGKLSTATTWGNRILARDSVETQYIDLTVRLPASKVGLIQAGHRLSVRLSFVPGFETFAWTRVEKWTCVQTDSNPDYYDIGLHLSTHGRPGSGGTGPGSVDPFPHQPPGPPEYVQEKGIAAASLTLDHPTTDGHLLTWFVTGRSVDITAITPAGWTMLEGVTNDTNPFVRRYGAVYYKIASGDGATFAQFAGYTGIGMHMFEWADGVDIDTAVGTYGSINDATAPGTLASVVITPSAVSTIVGNALIGSSDVAPIFWTPGAGVTVLWDSGPGAVFPPVQWVGIKTEQTGASSVGLAFTGSSGWGGITYAVHAGGAGEPPGPAQEEPWAVVTMDGADGTTEFPYTAGSLHLRLNGVPISTASYTERDPSCGDFTLSWVPFADDVITASYQGAS